MYKCGKLVTLGKGYQSSPESNKEITIRENWMNGPTMKNFTGCSGSGWNQDKNPCSSCDVNSQYGSRICNNCRNIPSISNNCGGNACAWQPN